MSTLDIYEILQHLPHRYPFLLVDRVLDYEREKFLIGIKNVSHNEPYFPGHFPERPVMPGVLILEALAQATGILAFKTVDRVPEKGSLYYFVGIDNGRFKHPVQPGDQLKLEVEYVKRMRGIWKFKGRASVDDDTVCTADLMCAERDYI